MKERYVAIPDMEVEKQVKHINKLCAAFAAAAFVLLIIVIILVVTAPKTDTIKYEGKQYMLLQYPLDIFYYDLNNSVDNYEEDETVSLEGSWWPMVYNNGDVFCHEDQIYDANAYYNNHENYDWYVIIETDDSEDTYPVNIGMDDFEYIYKMEDINKETAIFFDEIETMGTLVKISKDGFICGTTGLAQHKGQWYWRTETIDESRERDGEWPEYVIALPDDVSTQINGFE